jgi:hypothetical protein
LSILKAERSPLGIHQRILEKKNTSLGLSLAGKLVQRVGGKKARKAHERNLAAMSHIFALISALSGLPAE